MAAQSPELIRASIESTREELAFSVNDLRSKVAELTDWRRQLAENRKAALIGAAVAGFVIGGGVAARVPVLTGRAGGVAALPWRRRGGRARGGARTPAGG